MKKSILFFLLFIASLNFYSQPYADILSANCQTFSSTYDSLPGHKNKTDDYFLNFFLPKVFKNGNALLVRLNGETLNSTISGNTSYSHRISSVSLPLGMKLVSKNKKWETILIAVPKIASDFLDKTDSYDWQMGGIFLEQFIVSEKMKFKLGLYYNREAFGNFFMPLVGVDWRINKRLNLYGIIPSNFRCEVTLIKDRLYAGLCYKAATRSFRLAKQFNNDYVRYDEQQVKLFLEGFIYDKILLFCDAGYSVGDNPLQFAYGTKTVSNNNPVFTTMKSYPVFNFGIAYRVRLDLDNSKRKEDEE